MTRTPDPRARKTALALVLIGGSSVALAVCPPPYYNEVVLPFFMTATTTLQTAVTTVDASLNAVLETNSQRLMSAIAVLTKQKAMSANQIAESSRVSAEMTADALSALSTNEMKKQARYEFGPEFGQGFQPCQVYAKRSVMATQDAAMADERRSRVMTEIVAAPGRYGDLSQAQANMIRANKDYCTQDMASSGLCKSVGAMPGAGYSASTLFKPAMEGEPLYNAKVAFVNNVVGLPDAPLNQATSGTPAGQAYMLAKSRKDAMISPAMNALKAIQLDYSGVNGGEGTSGLPVAMQFQTEVKRYAGNTAEYQAWNRTMSSQNERGALLEALKIKALDLALLERQYRQYERMESMLAPLVALEVSGQQQQAAAAAQRAAANQASQAIR